MAATVLPGVVEALFFLHLKPIPKKLTYCIRSGGETTTKIPVSAKVLSLFKMIALQPIWGSGCFDGATSDFRKWYGRYR